MAFICNNDCICIDCDCKFFHPIASRQERKIIRKLFDNISNPIKVEPFPEKRKANCRYGKTCSNPDCGFRHRLAFSTRIKLKEAYDRFKLEATKEKKIILVQNKKDFEIKTNNHFEDLDIEEIEMIDEIKAVSPVIASKCWADMADDDEDFYLKF